MSRVRFPWYVPVGDTMVRYILCVPPAGILSGRLVGDVIVNPGVNAVAFVTVQFTEKLGSEIDVHRPYDAPLDVVYPDQLTESAPHALSLDVK
jgi:hypothetical protein